MWIRRRRRILVCSNCGEKTYQSYSRKPPDNGSEEELITHYFKLHYSYVAIITFLKNYYDIGISVRTLKRRLKHYGLTKRNENITEDQLHSEDEANEL